MIEEQLLMLWNIKRIILN